MYVITIISRMDFLRPTRSAIGAAIQHPYSTLSATAVGWFTVWTNNKLSEIREGIQNRSEICRDGVFFSRLVVGSEPFHKR